MLTKSQIADVEKDLCEYLKNHYGKTIESATSVELYFSMATVANAQIYKNKGQVETDGKRKTVHYMSIEFLLGKSLKHNLWNLGLEENFRLLLKGANRNIEDVYNVEGDAGLGNGGLGRLAACYLESLAKLGYSAFGHTIKYEYGLFKQKIVDGKQIEVPDKWLDTGRVWLEERFDKAVCVEIGGKLVEHYDDVQGLTFSTQNPLKILAVPSDMQITAYGSDTVSTLRLWEARAEEAIDLRLFDMGEYSSSLEKTMKVSEINKVLYPSDSNENGKTLRLIQQYFLVSASMQSIVRDYFENYKDIKDFPAFVSVHINDTHPALCIPELMRIFVDEKKLEWDDAWQIVKKTVSYTNHTILSESLEVKRFSDIEKLMPRIARILKEIDRRYRLELAEFYKNDSRKVESLSIIGGNNVYMANLSICGSFAVNGVAEIHSQILKSRLFKDFAIMEPQKFSNITNGISHTRWMSECNPKLDSLICSLIGNGYYEKPEELSKLKDYFNDENVLLELEKIKNENKKTFAKYIEEKQGININPNHRFDVQVKRIHEYKRQLLNVMKIIYLMQKIRNDPSFEVTPEVFIFGGKAASGYAMAKRIIHLINCVAKEIEEDEVLSSKIKVVFIENFNVTISEYLMPATDVSEQISLAGREASGTGNMKAVLNGALMLCTIDGANIEICDKCGKENMFEFGLTTEDVQRIMANGYNAMEYYINSDKVRTVVDKLSTGIGGENFQDVVDYLLGHSNYRDNYFCLADFDSYIDAYYEMDKDYKNKKSWFRKSLESIASMGYFSSDRSIEEYAKNIWKLK